MISVEEAKLIIGENSNQLSPTVVPLAKAAGLILAKDIHSAVNVPASPQSGMDGYAIAFADIGKPLTLAGEQSAGAGLHLHVRPGNAIRIFTGAVVPEGLDTVVIQEKSKVVDGFLQIHDDKLKRGDNVRLTGTEIAKDQLAVRGGAKLTPAAIGFLAGMGVASIEVIPMPRVSIIVTGNELQTPGTSSVHGKVYESNSFALMAGFKQIQIDDVSIYHSADDVDMLTSTLKEALLQSDVVLMTGGVSVGDYDFTIKASENCGVKKLFHKIMQKPGKPLYFGKKDDTLFFGLPGNPASALTCFYEYVLLALEKMTSQKCQLKIVRAPISSSYTKPAGITHFLKAVFNGKQVQLPGGQESYKLNSFADANCLVMIPESVTNVSINEEVEIHLLP